jgi:hypothetical protein
VNIRSALWVGILSVTTLGASATAPPPATITIGLIPIVPESVSAREMTAAREEASRLWARYGVQLTWLERRSDCARLTAPATCLFLILSRRLGSSGAAPPAGRRTASA